MGRTLILGKIKGKKRRGWQRMRWLDNITDSADMTLSKLQEIVKDGEVSRAIVHGVKGVRHNSTTTKTFPELQCADLSSC